MSENKIKRYVKHCSASCLPEGIDFFGFMVSSVSLKVLKYLYILVLVQMVNYRCNYSHQNKFCLRHDYGNLLEIGLRKTNLNHNKI